MNTTLVNLRTTVNSATHEGHRDLLLQAALLAQGFAIDTEQTGRKASQKPRWRATSHDIDAQDIKHHLQDSRSGWNSSAPGAACNAEIGLDDGSGIGRPIRVAWLN